MCFFFLEKSDFLCVSNSDKNNFSFLGYVNLYMVKNRIIVILILCKYFCHFPSKIYITLGINSLQKLSNFLRKKLSILGKMTLGFRSILVVNSEKNDNLF